MAQYESAGARLTRKHLIELDAATLRAAAAGTRVARRELGAASPALEVFARLPAGQHDVFARRIARAQHLQPTKARHCVHLARALLPTALERLRRLRRHLHMKHAD